jgi:acyl-coenzyme A thioesterase PaaI-like protein
VTTAGAASSGDGDAPTYPPERHILRDLAFTTEMGATDRARGWLGVGPYLRDQHGITHAGAVATLVDALGGGLAGLAALPDWMATADLTLHLLARPDVDTITADARVARAGRTTIVVEVDLHADGTPFGLATMTFAVLPRRDGNPVLGAPGDVTRMTMALAGSGLRAPLEASAGIDVRDAPAGVVHLPIGDYVRNSLGAVQGGMMAALATSAATNALRHAAGTPQSVVDLQVTYLSLARVGPVATRTTVLDASSTAGTARVELVDTGAGGKLTTVVRARTVTPGGDGARESRVASRAAGSPTGREAVTP